MLSKKCTTCGEEKPATLEHFSPQKHAPLGFTTQCKPCRRASARASIKRPEIAAQREAYRSRTVASGEYSKQKKLWREKNQEKTKAASAKSREKRKAANSEYDKAWREANPEKIAAIRKRTAEKLKQNPGYVLHRRVKARVRSLLTGRSFGVVEDILGYTRDELVARIESQFTERMSWEVLATGAIHIDHIRPVSSFDFTTEDCEGFKACWALSNLRPMWALENQRKGNRWESAS